MGGEVLVLDVDAGDLRRARERRTLAVDGQLGSDLVELALERPGEVGNLEVDPRMNGVEVPGTGRGNGQNRRAHRFAAPFAAHSDIVAIASTLPIGCCVCKYVRNPMCPVFSSSSWPTRCRARADSRPGPRSCGHTPPSCADSRLTSRRQPD